MQEEARWRFIVELDEKLLKGGIVLSEWCTFIVRSTDLAFVSGAHLATIITAVAGIETYLRSEYEGGTRETLQRLIDKSSIAEELKAELQRLRKYRNSWVHVPAPWNDRELLNDPEKHDRELEDMAIVAVQVLRRTIYESQWA